MELQLDACPVCRSRSELWHVVDGYRLERCPSCSFVFVNPRPSRIEITAMYRELGGHCRDSATAADVLESERVAPNSTADAHRIVQTLVAVTGAAGRLLDVGSGYGFFSAAALEAGFEVDALEIAPLERTLGREIAGVEALPDEFEDYEAPPATYDAILMSQVLEHAVDIGEWSSKAACLLRPGGVLCVAVPNFGGLLRRLLQQRDPYVTPPVHLNYFSAGNLRRLLGDRGLTTIRTETVSRVRADALARRLPRAVAPLRRIATPAVRVLQRPVLAPVDRSGLGMFLNVYARKDDHASDSVHFASE